LSASAIPFKLAVAFAATAALSPLEKSLIISTGLRQFENAKSVTCSKTYLNDNANFNVIKQYAIKKVLPVLLMLTITLSSNLRMLVLNVASVSYMKLLTNLLAI
jgi:hypothetical protein